MHQQKRAAVTTTENYSVIEKMEQAPSRRLKHQKQGPNEKYK